MADKRPKRIVLLGSTGSIGESALKVARELPDEIEIVALAAHSSVDKLAAQAKEFGVKKIALFDKDKCSELKSLLNSDVEVLAGLDGLVELASEVDAEMVLVSIIGTAGLRPALAAIQAGRDLAVASKEILVMAGEIVMKAAKEKGVKLLPVDSEHNAIFQCLEGHAGGSEEVSRLILTASGGPFRTWDASRLPDVQLADALKHPTWQMGRKITIDSATLFNKGLEMIEARWLFDIEMDRVDVIVHPQSIVHSMVEFVDGSTLAQLSMTDMCFPIQYAALWPRRLPSGLKPLNFAELAQLTFEEPRRDVFPAIDLAVEAGSKGGTLPAVLNAANEVAVQAFVDGQLGFAGIWDLVGQTMNAHTLKPGVELSELLEADLWAREEATSRL